LAAVDMPVNVTSNTLQKFDWCVGDRARDSKDKKKILGTSLREKTVYPKGGLRGAPPTSQIIVSGGVAEAKKKRRKP